MSVQEIPAFSIWKTLHEMIPTLTNGRPSEKSAEHLAKIIKSSDFSDVFVYLREPSMSFEDYELVLDKYKAFTTWFLGRFFYLLSCKRLNKSHHVYVDIQLFVLNQLSDSQLHVYDVMAKEYCKALNLLTKFIKSGHDEFVLDSFVPMKHPDLDATLILEPYPIHLEKNASDEFLVNVLKIIGFILNTSFDFHCYDAMTNQCLDELLFLLSDSKFVVKTEVLKIYLSIVEKIDSNSYHEFNVLPKINLFAQYFEQIIYNVYSQKLPTDLKIFENLLLTFLEINLENDRFLSISEYLLSARLEVPLCKNLKHFCKKKRKSPLYNIEDFDSYMRRNVKKFNDSVFCGLKEHILNDIHKFRNVREGAQEIKIYSFNSGKWKTFYFILVNTLENLDCTKECQMSQMLEFLQELSILLAEIRIQMHKFKIVFIEEDFIILKLVTLLNRHLSTCEAGNFHLIFDLFLNFSIISTGFERYFDIFTCFDENMPITFHNNTFPDLGKYKKEMSEFFQHSRRILNRETAFDYLNKFMQILSSGFFQIQGTDMELNYMRLAKESKLPTLKNLPHLLTIFNNCDLLISEILIEQMSSDSDATLKEVTKILPSIICISSSNFVKLTQVEFDSSVKVEIFCEKCHSNEIQRNKLVGTTVQFNKIDLDMSTLSGAILKNVLKYLTMNDPELKVAALEVLPYISNHILKFFSGNVARIWVEKAGDEEESVRRKFGQVTAKIIEQAQNNDVLSESVKNDIIDILFDKLLKLTQKSLEDTNIPLQETLLDAVFEISEVGHERTVLPTIRILIYLVMVPTSRHSLVAVNRFFHFAKTHNFTPNQLYKQYKREICELISHLCIVNNTLIDSKLSTSLCKISVTLGFYSAKDFLCRESQQLLPYFVVQVLKEPPVSKLMDEMATMLNVSLAELLTNIYGSIFLYAFLNQAKDDFKHILKYLETTTGQPSAILRKRNLWVILNELLLNFHEKKEKVILALDYLAKLDSDGKVEIKEYLSSRLLGLLQHFDLKLMGNNTNRKCWILRSLADFFVFMGPNYIGPLRFKIIAMLRTVDCEALPDLKCEVWDAFIKSCDIESLAPQLATIFVSLLPLIVTCPKKINEIFKYLLVNHEESTRDFIKDLFFVDDTKVDALVLQTIRRHVKPFDNYPLKIKMANYLKYLNHETVEVRIRSLKQLKIAMERNREELDKMILGYNGIDPVIVELIEILTLGCRDKDPSFRLACGEVIGELGAVEPSHLPRKYAQNNKNFPFFITDDSFIVQSLNELTKALQGEKNTVNMDRFALAIQEILKNYEISSDQNSARNDLWRQFPESQQMLMLPLLTSRYIVSQPQEVVFPVPLFGSEQGDNFQKWLYNWSRSLVSTLPQDNQIVLHPCLPAMKQDYRILMQFLPHILLHSVISDVSDNRERAFLEIEAVISSERIVDNCLSQLKATDHPDQIQCTKVVFIILDFLERWAREWQWTNGVQGRHDANFIKIKSFLSRFSKLELARCNFRCGEYPRALLLLEDHITSNPHHISDQLMFLTRVYAQLDEPDGVAGVTTLQTSEPPIEQRILSLEVSGKLSDAAACYERLPPPLKPEHFKGLIQCYLDLDNVNTALNLARGAQNPENPIDFGNMLLEMQAEPLWRLGRYDDLDTLLNQPELEENTSWGIQIGKTLLAFQNGDRQKFKSLIQTLKSQQAELLGATTVEEGAYQHGYEYIARLHSLNELEQVEKIAYSIISKPGENITLIGNLRKEWELRIKVVQESLKIMEPVLCLRRVAIEQAKRVVQGAVPHAVPPLDSLLGECWLMSATTAREVGVHQQSYTYALKAEEYAPAMLFVEKSKLHWMREEHEQALTALRRGLEKLLPDGSKEALASLSLEKRKICAEAKLLIASYNDKVSNVDTDAKTTNYKEAIDMYREWETGFVHIAQFFDRLFQALPDEERDAKGSDRQILIINYFCKSLRYGTKFVYQSLPRLLSIWFDYGTRLLDVASSGVREERKNKLIHMTKLIDDALQNLPAYVFLTAFSQIISRICHPQKEVYKELKSIIIKVLLHYPQQSMWTLISVIKSDYVARAKRCNEILNDPQLKTPSMLKLVKDFSSLAEKLIELCNKSIPATVEVTTISNLLRTLPRLLSKGDFSEIMIPTHKFRKLVLPNPDFTTGEHNPFPNHYVHIVGVEEEVTVLRSLQRPRKITFRGSDGKGYIQMLKPKDDLRKDFRLMEFNDIVNQLLSRESESRQRRLNIRLYSVSPLNEECGLIEWIPNLVGLRQVLFNIYKQQGKGMTIKEIKEASCTVRDPLTKKRDVFNKILLPKHPPVLGEWFRRTFPDAQSWYFARTAYIRTTAVISMVGYILGLGDRHGENILFDSVCGDTVHVDFNCLFNKGESFEWPERVPFRLTQNMVAAMGPLGVEGVFRKSCACTLKILRTNADTLMSIVTPFVYDPLVSWNKNSGDIACTLERTNEQAMEHVNNIKLRLDGIMVKPRSRAPSIPLSIEGQTNALINEAMSIDNLCQMYIGWGAYL